MTIKIERLSTANQPAETHDKTSPPCMEASDFHSNPKNSVFLKAEFRHALAREFRLEAVNLYTEVNNQSLIIPAFRKYSGQNQTLIIGAGFDKTGDIPLPPGISFADCINTLTKQLKARKQEPVTQLEVRSKHFIPALKDHSDKTELVMQHSMPSSEFMMTFSKYTRRNIRMPFNRGFHFEISTEQHHLDTFYALYLKQIHGLGSLPNSYGFFQELWEKCRDNINLFIGYMDEKPVVASFQLLSDDEVYGAWSGIHPDYKKHNVFLAMLWSIFKYSEQSGRKSYSLGRSSLDSGAYHFKKRLANQEQRIYYYRLDVQTGQSIMPRTIQQRRKLVHNSISWLIRHSPPQLMHTLSRRLIHRFY